MKKSEEATNIIVIGASAGGISAIARLIASLPANVDAAIFIVIHVPRNSMTQIILDYIKKTTALKCKIAEDGEKIINSTVYLAQADHHMMIEDKKVIIQKGAYENHWRPSIDVLFRSAAAAYDSCVTGIILTGLLDDGTSGMSAIKRSGGTCIIQDPGEAEFPDMPKNVMQNIEVDYNVSINEMGYVLSDLYSRKDCSPGTVPEDVKFEAEITRRMSSETGDVRKLGTPTILTCPDCGGVLTKINKDAVVRYRCYTGHSFTESSLENEQASSMEESLWVAIRMMEERKNLLFSMADNNKAQPGASDDGRLERAGEINKHIERLKAMLIEMGKIKAS